MVNTINWEKYIQYGRFRSTNGIWLPFKFEFDRLNYYEQDKKIIMGIIHGLSLIYDIVLIHTINPEELKRFGKVIFYPDVTNCKFKPFESEGYIIYDDVITTGTTIHNCIKTLGSLPKMVICLIDRRLEVPTEKIKYKAEIVSIYDILKRWK